MSLDGTPPLPYSESARIHREVADTMVSDFTTIGPAARRWAKARRAHMKHRRVLHEARGTSEHAAAGQVDAILAADEELALDRLFDLCERQDRHV